MRLMYRHRPHLNNQRPRSWVTKEDKLRLILGFPFLGWMLLSSRRFFFTTTMAAASISKSCSDALSAMPSIGLGTYMLKDPLTVLPKAIELGYRRIDCAPVYFNEDKVGDALHQVLNEGSVTREDLFIVSKLASPFHRREHVPIGLRKTLTDLRLDYLDLFLIHWPISFDYVAIDPNVRGYENEDIDDSRDGKAIDTSVSLHETWLGMQDVLEQGLVRHIGVSNVPVALLHELLANDLKVKPAVNQVELHPYLSQSRLVGYCQHRGIHVQAYSPLGTPGYKEEGEPTVLDDAVLKDIAQAHNISPSQVALAWALSRNTSLVCKASSEDHLRDNLAAASLKLGSSEIERISKLNRNYRFFRPEDWWGHHAPVFD
jgi:diketogulonate reductase-like aldo/keto reductase